MLALCLFANTAFCIHLLVGATLLQLYNEHRWALVPIESILEQYFDENKQKVLPRDQFPTLDAESYTYQLIPLQNMEEVYMTRQKDLPDGKRDVAIHRFPFAEFPLITSHIDPKFVIAHVGHVLSGDTRAVADFECDILFSRVKMPAETRDALIEKYPILDKVWTLFQAWTSPLPEGWENEESYVTKVEGEEYCDDCDEWSEPSSDGDSVCTPNRRIKAWLDEEEEKKLSKGKGKGKEKAVEVEEKSPSEVLKEIAAAAMADVPEPTTPPNRRKKKLTAFPPVPPEQLVAPAPVEPPAAVEAGPSAPVDPAPPPKKRAAAARTSKNPRKRKSEEELGPEVAAPAAQSATTTEDKAVPVANPNKRRRGAASNPDEAEVEVEKEKPAVAKRRRGAAATSKAVVEPEAEFVQAKAEAEAKPAPAKRGRGKASTSKVQVQTDVEMEVEEPQVEAEVAPAATKRKRAVAPKAAVAKTAAAKREVQPQETGKAEGSRRKPAKDLTNKAKKGESSAAAPAAEEPVRKTGRILRKRT